MMVVGREHRVVWISEGYKRVLPALGFAGAHEFVGQRIERVVPNTLLAQVIETGQAILADLLTNQADSFLVSRVPLRDAQSRVAGTGSTVLLLGETGTGKELLAQGIHAASVRAVRHFVGLNIAAVLDTPLEAEFFGVAPGAYTGADRKGRDGKFKLADGGTLFLDEIGNRPLQLQAKLLRALQEQEVEPLGSNQVQKVDVRVIAATRRDLVAMVADGRFRADLYYRLNVLPIRLPPLRERLADIEPLADALLDDIARRSGLPHRGLSAEALDRLAAHAWPGNIRDLRHVLEQAALMTDAPVLLASDVAAALGSELPAALLAPALPLPVLTSASAGADVAAGDNGARPPPASAMSTVADVRPLAEAVNELESRAVLQALAATGGNKLAAARLLGIARATLYDKLSVAERPAARGGVMSGE